MVTTERIAASATRAYLRDPGAMPCAFLDAMRLPRPQKGATSLNGRHRRAARKGAYRGMRRCFANSDTPMDMDSA